MDRIGWEDMRAEKAAVGNDKRKRDLDFINAEIALKREVLEARQRPHRRG